MNCRCRSILRTTSITWVFSILSSHNTQVCGAFCSIRRFSDSSSTRTPMVVHQHGDLGTSSGSSMEPNDAKITIIGFGSLLSERSSRTTFPDLEGFRLGRVPNYRRVFGHPASIFFQRGIANLETKEMSSLSAEYCDGHPGFICSVFEISSQDMMKDGMPSEAFLEREEEFNIVSGVEYLSLDDPSVKGMGILCSRSTDKEYLNRWGKDRFEKNYKQYGIDTIWGWGPSSGLLPCAVYLRHCYLAAKSMGEVCFDSFLDETFLVDRKTTVRNYLEQNARVLEVKPPPDLVGRYSG